MQQKAESTMVVRCELKIPSLGITVRNHSASLVIPNTYPRDGNVNPHLTAIKDSYSLSGARLRSSFLPILSHVPCPAIINAKLTSLYPVVSYFAMCRQFANPPYPNSFLALSSYAGEVHNRTEIIREKPPFGIRIN